AREWRRPALDPGAAGPCQPFDDADLHRRRCGAPDEGACRGAPARLISSDDYWPSAPPSAFIMHWPMPCCSSGVRFESGSSESCPFIFASICLHHSGEPTGGLQAEQSAAVAAIAASTERRM